MLVLLTTTNYPDIALPAYSVNRLYGLFFVAYLVIGFFIFMSILLAVFYSNFKSRFEAKLNASEHLRSEYLRDQFKRFGGSKNYLNKKETYRMFLFIHSLITNNKELELNDDDVDHHWDSIK